MKINLILFGCALTSSIFAQEMQESAQAKKSKFSLGISTNYRMFDNIELKNMNLSKFGNSQYIDGVITKLDPSIDSSSLELSDPTTQQVGSENTYFVTKAGSLAAHDLDIEDQLDVQIFAKYALWESGNHSLDLKLGFAYYNMDDSQRINLATSTMDFSTNKPLEDGNNIVDVTNPTASNRSSAHFDYDYEIEMYSFLTSLDYAYNLNGRFSLALNVGCAANYTSLDSSFSGHINQLSYNGSDSQKQWLSSIFIESGIIYHINESWELSALYRYEKFLDDLATDHMTADFDNSAVSLGISYNF